MIITIALVVLALAAVGYVLVSRMAGQPLNTRRMLLLPAVLAMMGLLQLAGAVSGGIRPTDAALLVAGLAVATGLGAARGATVSVFVRDGRSWLRYRPTTLALWGVTVAFRVGLTMLGYWAGATVAVSGPALLLSVGATLLAEGVIVARRASTSSGDQWQGGVSAKHTSLR